MVYIDTDIIEFYFPIEELKKHLNNRTAYLVRKTTDVALYPFKDEDSAQFYDILKDASRGILDELYRFAKELPTQMNIEGHPMADAECIIFYTRSDFGNMPVVYSVDGEILSALKASLVYEWFKGTPIQNQVNADKENAVSGMRSKILNLRVAGKGRTTTWL